MLYDPADLEVYAPLWCWDAGLYALMQGSCPGVPAVRQEYVPGTVHARSSWVTLELRACTAPVLLQARLEDMARVKRVDLSEGIGEWRLWDLHFQESHIGEFANRGKLSRKHGNLASAILAWPNDPLVRANCDNQTSLTTVAENGREFLVELPVLLDKPELLEPVLHMVEELLGAKAYRWDGTSAFQSTYEGLTLAFTEGTISPIGRALRVRVPIGNPEEVRPSRPYLWLQRELENEATTDVRLGPLPETLQLRALPPLSQSEIRLYNEHLGLSPVHLLSYETQRVLYTLRCVQKWHRVCPEVDCWPPITRATNLVEDRILRKQFLCVDAAAECFRTHSHLWRSNHENGRDSSRQEVDAS